MTPKPLPEVADRVRNDPMFFAVLALYAPRLLAHDARPSVETENALQDAFEALVDAVDDLCRREHKAARRRKRAAARTTRPALANEAV